MYGVRVVTSAAAAVLLMAFAGPAPALAETIEAALVRAYQNNPQLNAQRALVRSTDENVPQALSGYRPKVALTASAGYQYHRTRSRPPAERPTPSSGPRPTARTRRAASGSPSIRRCSTGIRPPTRPARRKPGVRCARGLARARADRAVFSRQHLHGLFARLRHRGGAEEQRAGAGADAEADPRSLQCRRGDAHRRRPVRSAARRWQDPGADGRIQPGDDAARTIAASSATSRRISRRVRRSTVSCRQACRRRWSSA